MDIVLIPEYGILTGADVGIAISGSQPNITVTVTINTDLHIPSGATLTIPEGLTVDVADAHQLILDSGGALDALGVG
ncbi:MAG: hypothetical protein LBP35_01180 [Candidatus Ancillula trichonymphae]|nr:hypothetical protein [Candidatus Ancillula trichonymphae]